MTIIYAPAHLRGKKVRIGNLRDTAGLLVVEKHLAARRANSTGTFLQFVPGHGGDAVAVQHGWGCAVYSTGEYRFIKFVKSSKEKLPRKLKKRQAVQVEALNGEILTFRTWNDAFPIWKLNRDFFKTVTLPRPLLKNPVIKPEHLVKPQPKTRRAPTGLEMLSILDHLGIKTSPAVNTRQKFEKILFSFGISENQATQIMDYVIPKVNANMTSMAISHKIDWYSEAGYPDAFYNTLFEMNIKPLVVEWIDANIPQAWFRRLFVTVDEHNNRIAELEERILNK